VRTLDFLAATLAATLATVSAPNLAAQEAGTVARPVVKRFPIQRSPIELTGPVRGPKYVGVTGPRSAWLGVESGSAELWVHPFKVAREFRLAFQVPEYRDPIPGSAVARMVTVRPELTTITYAHQSFTVREHILAPHDEAGLLILLDVEAVRPLEIVVEFEPVLQLMWPGAIGGQYMFWDEPRRAFVLSESLRTRNAVIGSPWATEATTHPAHRLAEAPATFRIAVDADRVRGEFVPIAIAAGTGPREDVLATYERLLTGAEELYRSKRSWADSVLATTTTIDSPDDDLDLALEWAKINLEEQRVCNPDLGCGFVAGWGISGTGFRPGFGWFFGGDAAMNTLAMDVTGQWDLVAEDLRFLARHQREDGKIPHEVSQAAARIEWFEEFPYPYYHADTTPWWMTAVWQYWKASGDDDFLREIWPAFVKAWEWCLSVETDGDGIIENTTGGLAAVEVGEIGSGVHQDVYLASVWTAALHGVPDMARALGEVGMAERAAELRDLARHTLNDAYWSADRGYHAFAILRSGETNDDLTVWPAVGAALSRRGCHIDRLGCPHALLRERPVRSPAVQQRHRLAFRYGVREPRTVPVPTSVGRLPPHGRREADDVRREPRTAPGASVRSLLHAARRDRAAPVLRLVHAGQSPDPGTARVGARRTKRRGHPRSPAPGGLGSVRGPESVGRWHEG